MSTVGVFSSMGENLLLFEYPHGTEHPARYSGYPPRYSNNKRFFLQGTEHPHGTHDIPHGTEHPSWYCTHVIQGIEYTCLEVRIE